MHCIRNCFGRRAVCFRTRRVPGVGRRCERLSLLCLLRMVAVQSVTLMLLVTAICVLLPFERYVDVLLGKIFEYETVLG